MTKTVFKQTFRQIFLLLAAAGVLAVGVNALRSSGLPLVGDWSAESRFVDEAGDSLTIDLDRARQLFEVGKAVFVDARPESQYAEGHIRGAVCLPWQDVDNYLTAVFDRLEAAGVIITYCDGESCELSHDLSLFLKEAGFDNVRVLVNGWTVWQQAGLPTAVDEQGI